MQRALATAVVIALATGAAWAQQAEQARQTEVPVRHVVLYSSGVGYFEHIGEVEGEAVTELRFKTEQINDILKSLLLEDTGGGHVGIIQYPSHDPLDKTLKSFQIDISGEPSLAQLLQQLRGAQVRIEWGAEQLTGTILGLERLPRAVGETTIQVWVLNLITDGAIRAIELGEIRRIELQDPQLQDELMRALAALAQARDQDKKPVTIQFRGEGERMVRLGYVVESPVWKTSYRLMLPGAGDEAARIQGWAIVENQTDNDWDNVQLSLVSGRPISFIQELYEPLYVRRPVVEPELWAGLRPRRYAGGIEQEMRQQLQREAQRRDDSAAQRRARAADRDIAPADSADADQMLRHAEREMRAPMDPVRSVAAAASAGQLGELFQYTIGNVSLPRQTSSMLPIITDEIELERLSIYNRGVLQRHPLNGALINNTSGKHLLQGPITVLDGAAYAGDAQIENLPPGQKRLISFGIDLDVLVDPTKVDTTNTIQTGRIVRGVLHISRKDVAEQQYLAENKSDRDKTLVIEHPIRQGWTLVDTAEPFESTEQVYRFRHDLPGGEKGEFEVTEQRTRWEQMAILPGDIGQLMVYQRTDAIPPDVRDALAEAIRRKEALVAAEREVAQITRELSRVQADQGRIRSNMNAAPRNSDYYNRLLAKLNEQETEIEKLVEGLHEAQEKLEQQRVALEDYLSELDVG